MRPPEEGCLSFPGIQIDVMRAQNINVNGINFDGNEVTMPFNRKLAREIQYEIDHPNGVLIFDYPSSDENILLHENLKDMVKQN